MAHRCPILPLVGDREAAVCLRYDNPIRELNAVTFVTEDQCNNWRWLRLTRRCVETSLLFSIHSFSGLKDRTICNVTLERVTPHLCEHRCREAARGQQGLILALDVDELAALLQARSCGEQRIWDLLEDHFRMLVS